MRINLNQKALEAGDPGESASASTRSGTGTSKSGALADKADISLDPSNVRSLAAQVNNLPDIRLEKVTALGLAIQQGNYHVSPQQTASAIVEEMESRFAA